MGIFEKLEERLERIELALAELARSGAEAPAPLRHGPRWLDPKQAAEYVGMSHQSLALYRSNGTGPTFSKIGQTVRYDRADLDDWLERSKR